MDEVAGSSTAHSLSPSSSDPSYKILPFSETVQSRIRSLLASRHERCPPRVPLPSPEPFFLPRVPERNTPDRFDFLDDVGKRLSVLEPPERRYNTINPSVDGSEDGTLSPGFLSRGHSWRQDQLIQDCRELTKSGTPYLRTLREGSDASKDHPDPGLQNQQRAPTFKIGQISDSRPQSPQIEKTYPRKARGYTRDAVPWEYGNSTDTILKAPPEGHPVPNDNLPKCEIIPTDVRTGLPIEEQAKDEPPPSVVNEGAAKEPPSPLAEESLQQRIRQSQRLRSHDDVRGYSSIPEDALQALIDRTPTPNHLPERQLASVLPKVPEETRTNLSGQRPQPESPLSAPNGGRPTADKVVKPVFPPENPKQMPPRISDTSKLSSSQSRDPREPDINKALSRTRAYSDISSWKRTEAGRQWINRLFGRADGPQYQPQLTEKFRSSSLVMPLRTMHDGSKSEHGPTSSSAENLRPSVNFEDPPARVADVNKAITELELLLREALFIANQAADREVEHTDEKPIPRVTVDGDRRRSVAPRKIIPEDLDEEELPSEISRSPSLSPKKSPRYSISPATRDWAYPASPTSRKPSVPSPTTLALKDDVRPSVRRPSIQPRVSSLRLKDRANGQQRRPSRAPWVDDMSDIVLSSGSDDGPDRIQLKDLERQKTSHGPTRPAISQLHRRGSSRRSEIRAHVRSFKGQDRLDAGFVDRTPGPQPIARNWGTPKKRVTAAIACLNSALLGVLIGIYAGEVPAIQYAIVDTAHYAILGNVFFYIGLAIPTLLSWPLPILHGRKPYTIMALSLLLPLQLPQGISVNHPLSRNIERYRALLLSTRGISGLVMGFANMNFQSTLLDLFGASLQSANPHEEELYEHDVRRHGGGMGVWLGIWSWCSLGSIPLGFFIGTGIITNLPISWGFWVALILTVCMLAINVAAPEVRKTKDRRSLMEIWTGSKREKRVQYGEITIHVHNTGAKWFGKEVLSGLELSWRMMKQPGFFLMSIYTAWVYGQVVLVVVLLGALTSREYRYEPPLVGLSVFSLAVGALLAVPFQKASVFSRSRTRLQRTDSMTFQSRITKSSHLVRRVTFMVLLPLADMAYTLASVGPSVHSAVPTVFAGAIGFLSNMALAECYGLIMETFDLSDLQPGMIGRPRKRSVSEEVKKLRTPFTCHPRVSAAFALCQGFGFLIAAAATGAGGALTRRLGAQHATGVVAGILFLLTVLLTAALWRWKIVVLVPDQLTRSDTSWEATVIGRPSGKTRRMSLLELGRESRWAEISRRNRLGSISM